MLSLCKLPYLRSSIVVRFKERVIAVDYPLKEYELCEGDCVEVTTTTGMIQNQVSVEEDGEVVVHFTNVLPPRPLFNDLVWATVVEFHIGRDFHVR